MAEFAWVARAATGEVQKGVMVADTKEAVERRLRAQQLNPQRVSKIVPTAGANRSMALET